MQELVLEMAYAGAFGKAERGSDYRIEPGPLLTEMHQRGYVEVSPMAAGSNLWILTQKAKSLLCQSTRLLKPTPLTRFQRDLPLDKLTTLELIGRLGDEGWDDEATPKTTKLEPFTGWAPRRFGTMLIEYQRHTSNAYSGPKKFSKQGWPLPCTIFSWKRAWSGSSAFVGSYQRLIHLGYLLTCPHHCYHRLSRLRYYLCILYNVDHRSGPGQVEILPGMSRAHYLQLMGREGRQLQLRAKHQLQLQDDDSF